MKNHVGMDTETNQIDFKKTLSRLRAEPIGMSASIDGKEAIYTENREDWREMLEEINEEGLTTIWHNFKFDKQVLRNANLPEPKFWEDTAIAGVLLNENRINKLKPLAAKLLGVEDPMVFGEAEKAKVLDPSIFEEYAKNDARYTYRLWDLFAPALISEELIGVYNLEKAMVDISLEIERNGILMDVTKTTTMASKVTREVERLTLELYKKAGKRFNVNSNPQLREVLFVDLGLDVKRRSFKTGEPSAAKEVLQDLEEEDETGFITALMEFRKLDKLASGFLNTLPKFLDKENRIHATLNSIGAKTGRTTSSNPNLQNIPIRSELGKALRGCFIVPKGHKLLILDYSQMELRALAEYVLMKTGERTMFDALASGKDFHIATAEQMFQKSITKDDDERLVAKRINFGIAYGISAFGLRRTLREEKLDFPKSECQRFLNLYFATYPGVDEFMNMVIDLAQRRGYVRNLYGRKRRTHAFTERQQRQIRNFPIQGSCADIIKTAMVEMYKEFRNSDVKMIGFIHDEILLEVPEEIATKTLATAKEIMEFTPPGFRLKMPVDGKIATDWSEK